MESTASYANLGTAELDTLTTRRDDDKPQRRPLALLACRDGSARKWGLRWLERAGFDVHLTQDGPEAVALLESSSPAIVVVDTSVPDGNGGRLFSSFRKLTAGRVIPLVTLCYKDRDVRAALDEGASDVMKKPFDWQIISRRAEQLVQLTQTIEELDRTRSMLGEAHRFVEDARERVQRSATVDRVTGLPNRAMFEKLLESSVGSGPRGVAVLLFDLDRFKVINSSLGRHVGDEILRQVADRLSHSLRGPGVMTRSGTGVSSSSLARMNGDVFGLMLSGVDDAEDVRLAARTLSDTFSESFDAAGDEVFLTASVGVALSPQDAQDADELLHRAELALCESKRKGGGIVCYYNDSLNQMTERNMMLIRALRTALARDELRLHYQPLVDAASKRVMGAEALLRWNHPEMGAISPGEFIPLAEESGLMVSIGSWVLRTACDQLRAWVDAGLPPIRMAVNVSLCQMVRSDLPAVVREVLEQTGIDPALLEIELSERGVLRSDPDILNQLKEIKQLGVRLSVDDFGTGNSAIAYLRRFPLDALKIDGSYIRGLQGSENDAAITSATIAMAHQLSLGVVAECVENEQQLGFLQDRECDEFQGFLFSPAVPPEDFQRLLAGEPGRD